MQYSPHFGAKWAWLKNLPASPVAYGCKVKAVVVRLNEFETVADCGAQQAFRSTALNAAGAYGSHGTYDAELVAYVFHTRLGFHATACFHWYAQGTVNFDIALAVVESVFVYENKLCYGSGKRVQQLVKHTAVTNPFNAGGAGLVMAALPLVSAKVVFVVVIIVYGYKTAVY